MQKFRSLCHLKQLLIKVSCKFAPPHQNARFDDLATILQNGKNYVHRINLEWPYIQMLFNGPILTAC